MDVLLKTMRDNAERAGDLALLIERLAKLAGPCRETDLAVHLAVYPGGYIARLMKYPRGLVAAEGTHWDIWQGGAVVYETRDEHGRCYSNGGYPLPNYTASIDAALSLAPEGLAPVIALTGVWARHMPNSGKPIWEAAFPDRGTEDFEEYTIGEIGDFEASGTAATPAIALCIAALKARQSSTQ